MSLPEFVDLVIGISFEDVRVDDVGGLFNLSLMTRDDEYESETWMEFIEFLEGISRVAEWIHIWK